MASNARKTESAERDLRPPPQETMERAGAGKSPLSTEDVNDFVRRVLTPRTPRKPS